MHLLFICDGNTCRSPMAAALAAAMLPPGDCASSAGVGAADGQPAAAPAAAAIAETGGDLSGHRSRQLTPAIAAEADIIFTMAHRHIAQVAALSPASRVLLLSAAAGEQGDIDDPYGADLPRYRATRDQMKCLLEKIMPRLPQLLARPNR